MNDTKAVSRSVSLPANLWDAFDEHAVATDGDRSTCAARLIRSELESCGKLPNSNRDRIRAKIEALESAGNLIELERLLDDLLAGVSQRRAVAEVAS